MSGLELLESERRSLGFWGQNFDIDPRVSWNVDNGLYSGSGIVVDPRDGGHLALANGIYRNRVNNMVNSLEDEKRSVILNELAETVSGHTFEIDKLGVQTKALYNVTEDIINARHYATSSVMGVSSEIASIISGVLYRVPGINAVWASTFGVASEALKWYVEMEATRIMKRSLSMTRSLFLDNAMTNMLNDDVDRRLRNEDDPDSRVERILSWLSEKSDFFKRRETNMMMSRMGDNMYGTSFYTVCDPQTGEGDESALGIITPEISDSSPTLRYGLIDLDSKTMSSDIISFSSSAMMNAIESLRYQFMSKFKNKRMKCEGVAPYMADEDAIVKRYDQIPSLISSMTRGFDITDIAKSIVQLLQSGKRNGN